MYYRSEIVNDRNRGAAWLAMLVMLLVAACTGGCGLTRNPVPEALVGQSEIPGLPGARAWGGQFSPTFQADLVESVRQARAADPRGVIGPDGYVNVLAISGGGSNGAFGAGLLCGWTAAGNRPPFKLVTGISTGALIAPFAFIGPEYDEVIKKFYTSVTTADIYTSRPIISILMGTDALSDTTPLAHLLESCMDAKTLAAIAREHKRGRRLYIGTTNLDAGRLVVWNMGAIAASGRPEALDLFRQIMRASAAIPVAFPPVYINVEAGGKTYDEMHVDGGAITQVFFYGFMLDLQAAAREAGITTPPPIRIYVLRNAQISSDWQAVRPRLLPIASRAVTGLLFTQGVGDLYRIYTIATRDGIDFKLATIPPDYHATSTEAFDRGDMNRLFDLAFGLARTGYPWQSLPPGLKERSPSAVSPATTSPAAGSSQPDSGTPHQ